jgi:hypothetical protein
LSFNTDLYWLKLLSTSQLVGETERNNAIYSILCIKIMSYNTKVNKIFNKAAKWVKKTQNKQKRHKKAK